MLKHIIFISLLAILVISDKPQQIYIALTGKANEVTISWVSKGIFHKNMIYVNKKKMMLTHQLFVMAILLKVSPILQEA
jgi:hypothetical protein